MPRRSNHEGSVYQRSDGLWVGTVQLGNKRLYRYGKSKSEAACKLQAVLKQHHQGTLAKPTKITLREWIEQWQAGRQLRPSTRRTYDQVLAPVLKDAGHIRLDRLTPVILSLTFSRLERQGMGRRRLQLAHGYLRSCLERAVDLEVLGRNPMGKLPRPRWEPRPRRYWTVEQAWRFMETCLTSQTRWAPLFVILTTCGLRYSEAIGLRWRDVDLERRVLRVHQALVWAGGTAFPGDPKSSAGYREVTLMDAAVAAFELLQSKNLDDAVFVGPRSGHAPRNDALRKPLMKLCAQADVPYVNLHGLRHVHAALALRATRDHHAVQKRLGHSRVTTTLALYGYATHSGDEVASALDDLLNGDGGN